MRKETMFKEMVKTAIKDINYESIQNMRFICSDSEYCKITGSDFNVHENNKSQNFKIDKITMDGKIEINDLIIPATVLIRPKLNTCVLEIYYRETKNSKIIKRIFNLHQDHEYMTSVTITNFNDQSSLLSTRKLMFKNHI